jgi:hypothetical protein
MMAVGLGSLSRVLVTTVLDFMICASRTGGAIVASFAQIYQPPEHLKPYQAEGLRSWGRGPRHERSLPRKGVDLRAEVRIRTLTRDGIPPDRRLF